MKSVAFGSNHINLKLIGIHLFIDKVVSPDNHPAVSYKSLSIAYSVGYFRLLHDFWFLRLA
jgi:hypothetical protein